MHPTGTCKCQHCGEFFLPDARNRGRQRACRKVPCRQARKAASQRSWLSKAANRDYFLGETNVARVRAWRQANPGYWKRRKRGGGVALQDRSITQAAAVQQPAQQDGSVALQDILRAQSPVVVGLIAHLTGMTLQDDIVALTRTLHSRGQAVLGLDAPRPPYAKTPARSSPGAAHAAPV